MAAAMIAHPPATASGQPAVCEECIGRSLESELHTAAGPIVPSLQQYVVRAGQSELLVSYLWVEPQIVAYGLDGDLLRVFGRRGQGPGELSAFPLIFHGADGAIYAYERERLHRFTSGLEHLSTVRVDRRMASRAVVLPDGRIVVDDRVVEADGMTATVSMLTDDGQLDHTVESRLDPPVRTVIAQADDGGFWTVPEDGTTLRRYSREGRYLRSLEIDGGVVEPWSGRIPGEGSQVRPRPRQGDIVDLGEGTLLLVAWVADEDWEPSATEGAFRPSEENSNRRYGSVIQWVDSETGVVQGLRRVREFMRPVGGAPGFLYSVHEGDFGHAVTRIWRVEVDGTAR